MPVKILHAADFHLDSPFDGLSAELSAQRRAEQRELLHKLAELANRERVQLVLLAGDLLDSAVSYHETTDALTRAFSSINARIFIAPGNHDYYCAKSPYAYIEFPENVHIFRSETIECVPLSELNCRVWGAGFNIPHCRPLLTGFQVPADNRTEIMVMHGEVGGDVYNGISEQEIEFSGLDYLALGHIHAHRGISRAGKTHYAYSGCPEARGFDETGKKGVLVGEVSAGACELRFVPLGGREYNITDVNLTGCDDARAAIAAATESFSERDVCRILLRGEFDGRADTAALEKQFADRFFQFSVRDMTRPRRDIWGSAGADTLRGVFLREMREKYDGADEEGRGRVALAVRYGLAALENGEEWQV
ncbi:MAG: DNA repair exonuclease [Oscillospiraceae bacterium]|jgi:DNA repair exonuclease SbcCD nuclease subunit|nr:DNA repair exonuclease [Oscillospiraceae bacterium]